ncbi:diaminopimelate epimerase [Alicyclobacillus cycloheptanicus]|uniref:Diaminopimelate epimerase n=1 Tax=Alicyclobacillus cycloheptanicus TaxID=1457 RepID=A0ABT9XD29_9BACL|nr:diaminopimelate epimerase [Alicyclobacillus cycloheptanicus]MDQ0188197.1 diaminopimelate epimerase [Alicyclobacillus cycloheptanicus]WDM00928.1 diaminopimelate epimerase [Alicyclobacillus cycloheptanicus]
MKITKMHGLGNCYIYVSTFEESLREEELPSLAIAVSDIRKGIGSDGLILIGPSEAADVRMRIFNADGSEAENCGNGLRCVAKYAVEHGYVGSNSFTIETKGGIVEAYAHRGANGKVGRVTVDMGVPMFGPAAVGYLGAANGDAAVIAVGEDTFEGQLVSVGNPHFVAFVENAVSLPVAEIGPHIERHPDFPNRVNVEFVTPRGQHELDFRVWERGSGITYACGTGACASVAAGVKRGLLSGRVTVHLLGGDLEIEMKDGHVWMTGEAVEVLTGEYPRS